MTKSIQRVFNLLSAVAFLLIVFSSFSYGQKILEGTVIDIDSKGISFVTCALYRSSDSMLLKVESSDDKGQFSFMNVQSDSCRLVLSFVGMQELIYDHIHFIDGQKVELGLITMNESKNEIETVVVSSERSLIESRADRVIFNVAGTINSTGDSASELLRKSPGINVGANGTIKLLGREGILFLVDGKPSPLSGEDLNDFLDNLTSDQIDKIELIHNPGVQYEAQGKGGVIDIRLRKDERLGFNTDLRILLGQGRRGGGRIAPSFNYKNKRLNIFGSAGYIRRKSWSSLVLDSELNGFSVKESLGYEILLKGYKARYGFDYFLKPNHTLGFLGSRTDDSSELVIDGSTDIGRTSQLLTDSILISQNISVRDRIINNYNVNYVFDNKDQKLSVDFDYGEYSKNNDTDQPNSYYLPDEETLLTTSDKFYASEIEIDLMSAKVDYSKDLLQGRIGLGGKWAKVKTANSFLFYDIEDNQRQLNNNRSNIFNYDENIYAGYVSYSKSFTEKVDVTLGLRLEQTFTTGDLDPLEGGEDMLPIDREYLNLFPNLSVSYAVDPMKSLSFSYGRRINRPNYRRLNPFKAQVNEIGFDRGNPFLRPEIANNFEIGMTLKRSYSFKLAYSRTIDKIVELIGPDEESPLAGFLGYENLATQDVLSFSATTPFSIMDKIRVNNNMTVSYNDNNAFYNSGIIIANDAFNFSINQSYDYRINHNLSTNVTCWFTSTDLWDGIQFSRPNYSLGAGVKWSLLDRNLTIRCNVSDIFFSERFQANSDFNGRVATMISLRDTRRLNLSIRYLLGNFKVKSRRRNTGNVDEMKRV